MVKLMKLYDEAFVTGCDKGHEWILPWFLNNYKQHVNVPLVFANFGLTEEGLNLVKDHAHAIMDLTSAEEKGWFKKPLSMLKCPAKKTVWIDTDCQIKEDVSDIFDLIEEGKLYMVEDKPWTQRRGEVWHNSGVVGFVGKPPILYQWVKAVKENPTVGDQETLHSILNPITKIGNIADLPNRYNVMRLQVEHDSYKGPVSIMHWTGRKGKDRIRNML